MPATATVTLTATTSDDPVESFRDFAKICSQIGTDSTLWLLLPLAVRGDDAAVVDALETLPDETLKAAQMAAVFLAGLTTAQVVRRGLSG